MEKWFKISFTILAFLYVCAWIFTMQMSAVQGGLGYTPQIPVVPSDSQEYSALSESLVRGNGFTLGEGPETYRVPGYPAFVAAIRYMSGGSYFAVTFVQIILVLITALVVRNIGSAYASSTVGGIAALLLLLNPTVITLSLTIMTDILFLFLFLLGFYAASVLFERRPVFAVVIASIAFSACLYERAMGLFALPIFLAPFLIASAPWRKKLIAMAVVILIMLLSLLPWMQRNYVQTGVFSFTSFTAINLAQYSVPMYWAWQNGTTVETEIRNLADKMNLPHESWRDISHSAEINRFATRALLERPFSYLFYHLTLSLPFLFSSSIEYMSFTYKNAMHIAMENRLGGINLLVGGDFNGFVSAVTSEWWKVAERVAWFLLYALAFVGLAVGRKKTATWIFVFVIAYLMFLAGPAANARYAIQTQPFIFILSACGLLYSLHRLREKRSTI